MSLANDAPPTAFSDKDKLYMMADQTHSEGIRRRTGRRALSTSTSRGDPEKTMRNGVIPRYSLAPGFEIRGWHRNSIAAHRMDEATHSHAPLFDRVFSFVKIEKPDTIEMNLNRGIRRVTGEP